MTTETTLFGADNASGDPRLDLRKFLSPISYSGWLPGGRDIRDLEAWCRRTTPEEGPVALRTAVHRWCRHGDHCDCEEESTAYETVEIGYIVSVEKMTVMESQSGTQFQEWIGHGQAKFTGLSPQDVLERIARDYHPCGFRSAVERALEEKLDGDRVIVRHPDGTETIFE